MDKAKRFRDKLSTDKEKWAEFKQKERDRIAKYRKEKSANNQPVQERQSKPTTKEQKRKWAETKRLQRERKSFKITIPNQTPLYKSKQSLFKAVNRVRQSLPQNDDRKKLVLKELFSQYYPEASKMLNKSISQKTNILKQNLRKEINHQHARNFYSRSDISYEAPGKSDVMFIKNANKQKELRQKRYMVMTVGEAYDIYKDETDKKNVINRTKFYELRPQNIFVVNETPHNVCVCQSHSNFDYLCKALKSLHGFPSSYQNLLKELTCNPESEDCMTSKCQQCDNSIRDVLPILFEYETCITWKKWMKDEKSGRIKNIKQSGPAEIAVQELEKQILKFKKHVFINHVQSHHFLTAKNLTNETDVVLQIDFAENFGIPNQDEVQAAHFAYDQVCLNINNDNFV